MQSASAWIQSPLLHLVAPVMGASSLGKSGRISLQLSGYTDDRSLMHGALIGKIGANTLHDNEKPNYAGPVLSEFGIRL